MADIKTMGGRVNQQHLSYQSYFKLGALEIQKMRKQKEREAAISRIEHIDKCLDQINNELNELRNQLSNETDMLQKKDSKISQLSLSNGLQIKY